MKTKVRISGSTGQKLMFVKLVKDYTGMGLRESKDLVDTLSSFVKFIEIEIDNSEIKNAISRFEEIGLTAKAISRELKLKRILYTDQSECLKDLLNDISLWKDSDILTEEDKKTLTYDQCRQKVVESIFNEYYSEYLVDKTFDELYKDICNINQMEVKSTDAKILKFNEEFGEFVAEYIKLKGYTYKEFDRNHLIEEMADTLQCLLSIYAGLEKETDITLKEVLSAVIVKNQKWVDKIKEYKCNKDKK